MCAHPLRALNSFLFCNPQSENKRFLSASDWQQRSLTGIWCLRLELEMSRLLEYTYKLTPSFSKCSVLRAENLLWKHNRQQRHWALRGMGIGRRPLDLIS